MRSVVLRFDVVCRETALRLLRNECFGRETSKPAQTQTRRNAYTDTYTDTDATQTLTQTQRYRQKHTRTIDQDRNGNERHIRNPRHSDTHIDRDTTHSTHADKSQDNSKHEQIAETYSRIKSDTHSQRFAHIDRDKKLCTNVTGVGNPKTRTWYRHR